jgi:hypothetical protein
MYFALDYPVRYADHPAVCADYPDIWTNCSVMYSNCPTLYMHGPNGSFRVRTVHGGSGAGLRNWIVKIGPTATGPDGWCDTPGASFVL